MSRWWNRSLDSQRTHAEVASVDRQTTDRMRKYVITFKDGTKIWLRNVTSIIETLKSENLELWGIERTLECIRDLWTPDVAHPADFIASAIEEAREARFRKMRQAGSWGTAAHELIELFLKHGEWLDHDPTDGQLIQLDLASKPDQVINSVQLFREWWHEQNLALVLGEKFIFSLKYGFGGTLDYLARETDPPCHDVLFDFKTGTGVYEEALLQMGAYGLALHEETGKMPNRAEILHISREGDQWSQIPCWRNMEEARILCKHFIELANKNELRQFYEARKKQAKYQKVGAR